MSEDAKAIRAGGREEAKNGAKRALVLSGGGARGAYEAGVLQYVFGPLARQLGKPPKIHVYIGTSVGAVNTCFMAGHADDPSAGVAGLRPGCPWAPPGSWPPRGCWPPSPSPP